MDAPILWASGDGRTWTNVLDPNEVGDLAGVAAGPAGFVRIDRSPAADDEPLGVRLAKALQAAGSQQRDGLRQVGDHSLFISGFFADSLNRSLVDVDYYIQLGECAYGSLARRGDATFGEVCDEDAFCAFLALRWHS